MEDRIEVLKEAFFVSDKDVYNIPLKGHVLLYNKDIIELAKFKKLFEKAESDIGELDRDPNKKIDFIMRPNILATIFADNLADEAVALLISCEIFDLSKSDLLKSHGEIRSAMREGHRKVNKHNSVGEELDLVREWKKELDNRKGDADAIFKIFGDGFKHLARIYLNLRFDVESILGINDEYADNKDKVASIIKNMESGLIPEKQLEPLIVKSLQLYPFERKLYDMGYKMWGDEDAELNDLETFMMMNGNIYNVSFFGTDTMDSSQNDEEGTNKAEDSSAEMRHQATDKSTGIDDNNRKIQRKEKEYKWSDVIRLLPEKFSMQAVYYIRDGNEKTDRKMVAAMEAYANSMEKDELPLGVYDDTLMGACDEGVLLTTLGVRIHTSYQDGDEGVFIPYKDIETVEVRKGFLLDNIYINDEQVSSSMMGDDKKTFCNVISFLCQVIPKVGPVPPKQSQSTNHQLSHSEQNSSQKRFCPNCGKKIEHEGKFCSYCGTKIR